MKKLSLILTLFLLGLLIPISPVKCEWSTPTRVTSKTPEFESVSISGDGSKIVFHTYDDDNNDYEIFVVNSDGTGLTQLTSNTAMDDFVSISGDGTKIAYVSDVDGDWEIFVVNSDGTGLTQLTNNNARDQRPSINSDGTKIAFESDLGSEKEIFIINQDTIPEFTLWIILPIVLFVTVVITVYRKKITKEIPT